MICNISEQKCKNLSVTAVTIDIIEEFFASYFLFLHLTCSHIEINFGI